MKYKSKEVSIRRSKHACIVYINLFLTPILLVFQSFHFLLPGPFFNLLSMLQKKKEGIKKSIIEKEGFWESGGRLNVQGTKKASNKKQ